MRKCLSITIYGRVQGVFFRDSVQRQAQKLNLTGWVKNESDGTVVIVAEGEEEKLKELIKWCYNGPRQAKVEKVEIAWAETNEEFKKFEIR